MRLAVRLTPRASADRLLGVACEADGTPVLRAQVTAAPEDGKANAALVALLAKRWRVPRSSVAVIQGATARRKLLLVTGDPDDIMKQISGDLDG
ncbi:MAG: DUF167 family protein [Alphaproteobacteria bacterium]